MFPSKPTPTVRPVETPKIPCDACGKLMAIHESWLLDAPHAPGFDQKWLACSIPCILDLMRKMEESKEETLTKETL